MIFIDIFYGILLIFAGAAMIKYRRNIKSWTGNFLWAEKYLGRGGTYIVMILFALFLIFLGVLFPFWGLDFIFWVDSSQTPTILQPNN